MAHVLHPGRHGTAHPSAPTEHRTEAPPSAAGRRVGYVVAALVNAVLLWLVNQLLGWGWPPFLTPAFDDLLPWIDASLVATIALNVLWVWRDPHWLRQVGQLVLNGISLAVVVRTWRIFPLDLSGYWSGWEPLAHVALGVAFAGLLVDSIVRVVRLARGAPQPTTPIAREDL